MGVKWGGECVTDFIQAASTEDNSYLVGRRGAGRVTRGEVGVAV